MKEIKTIDIILEGEYEGTGISPSVVDISYLKDLLSDVEVLFRPDPKMRKEKISIGFSEGSLKMSVNAAAPLVDAFVTEINSLGTMQSFMGLHPRRAKVLKKWHARTLQDRISFNFGLSEGDWKFQLSEATPIVAVQDHWVSTEKYLFGEVANIGGVKSPNLHLRTKEYGTVLISIRRDEVKEDSENRAYKNYLIRISCEENLTDAKIRNCKFLEWVDYYPEFDPKALDESIAAGEQAWGHVADSAKYIRNLRGYDD